MKHQWDFFRISVSLILTLSPFTISCHQSSEHQPVSNSKSLPVDQKSADGKSSAITFDTHIQPIFKARCSICHTPGGPGPHNWLDYNEVSQNLSKIKERALEKKNMPPSSPLESQELKLIAQWIEAGAPKSNNNAPTTTPSVPSPTTPPVASVMPPTATTPPLSLPPIVPQNCKKDLSSALLTAVKAGILDDVNKLLMQQACTDAKDDKGRSAILIAILDGDGSATNINIISNLISAGADLNASYNGGTALIWAEFNENPEVTSLLIKAGANVNVMVEKGTDDTLSSVLGYTPLMLAIQNADYAMTSILLSNGADPLLGPKEVPTALILANQVTPDSKRNIIVSLLNALLPPKDGSPSGDLWAPTFSHEIQKIFNDKCALCHNAESSPKMNWLDYNVAYQKRSLIYTRIVLIKDMPMKNDYVAPITDNEKDLIAKWVKAGAPK